MARTHGREILDVTFGSRHVIDAPRLVQPLDTMPAPGHLVPVTAWARSDLLVPAQPYRAAGRYGRWRRNPCLLPSGVVVRVAVVATLVVCLVIALAAWVSAHAVAVGVGIAAVVVTALVFLRALTRACHAGPLGGCCQWGDHRA